MTERSAAVKSAWAEGLTYFAVALLITVGIFQVLQGLTALFSGELYVAVKGNMFALNVTTWGWIHLVVGIIAFAVGVGLFYGASWARAVLPRLVDRHHCARRRHHLGAGELPLRQVHVTERS